MKTGVSKNLKKIVKATLCGINRNSYNRKKFEAEVLIRSKLPVTAIDQLAKHINLFTPYTFEINQSNDYYGQASVLKKFIGLPLKYQFKFVIEHGIYLESDVGDVDTDTPFSTILTCCKYRISVLKKYKTEVEAIGPIFQYASSLLLKSEINSEKSRLGKNLLIFPSHSVPGIDINFNIDEFCQEIKKIGQDFQTIRVCLYWKDVLRGLDKIYRQNGFDCVTAGHVLDPNFLPRLKSIIETSTFTASNDAGAHVGYCIMLNKPHLIIKQSLIFAGQKSGTTIVQNLHKAKPFQEILQAFNEKPGYKISRQQRDLVNKYWGANQVKTKEELTEIIEQAESSYKKSWFGL